MPLFFSIYYTDCRRFFEFVGIEKYVSQCFDNKGSAFKIGSYLGYIVEGTIFNCPFTKVCFPWVLLRAMRSFHTISGNRRNKSPSSLKTCTSANRRNERACLVQNGRLLPLKVSFCDRIVIFQFSKCAIDVGCYRKPYCRENRNAI